MRYILALGLLLALSASADAARLHHARSPLHAIAGPVPSYGPVPSDPYRVPAYGSPEWERLHRENMPSYDDPSKQSPGG
jgi:hypothetical protein